MSTPEEDPALARPRIDSSSGMHDTLDYISYSTPPAPSPSSSSGADASRASGHLRSQTTGSIAIPKSAATSDAAATGKAAPAAQYTFTGSPTAGNGSIKSGLSLAPQASLQENPKPQASQAPNPTMSGTNGDKMVVVMVGLPARGKTYIARKLAHYFKFFHGAPTGLYNVGNYRRKISGASVKASFFDVANKSAVAERKQAATEAMEALKAFMREGSEKGRVGIYDATNTTRERREWIVSELIGEKHGEGVISSKSHVVFVEIVCTNESIIDANIRAVKATMPDYQGQTPDEAVRDFRSRIQKYEDVYQTITDETLSYIKSVDEGRQVTANNIRGNLQSRVMQFILSLHNTPRPIYLSRHGQSEYNQLGKVGGDSDLSPAGEEYALKLAEFASGHVLNPDSIDPHVLARCNPKHARLWTSSLVRTIRTARHINHDVQEDGWVTMRPRVWRNLDEIYAGIFDGLTYKEIQERAPDEFAQRQQNKLGYRYPRGESYLDVIARLEPLVHEIERQRDPVMIVGHQGILRIVYCYFMGIDRQEAPFHKIPLNTVIKLTPAAYGCKEERICLIPGEVASLHQPSH